MSVSTKLGDKFLRIPKLDYESPLGARSFMRHKGNTKQSGKSALHVIDVHMLFTMCAHRQLLVKVQSATVVFFSYLFILFFN